MTEAELLRTASQHVRPPLSLVRHQRQMAL